jgi:hypothetical protein
MFSSPGTNSHLLIEHQSLLYSQEEILPHAAKLLTFQVESEVIVNAVGDLARGTQSHNFKSTTFKIPTNCDLCGERIWGLTSKGFTCTDCGYSCHSKCEMKVPAQCPGVLDKAAKKALREERKQLTLSNGGSETDLSGSGGLTRANTVASSTSTLAPRGVNSMGTRMSKSPSISGASIASNASSTNTVPSAAAPVIAAPIVVAPPTRRVLAPPPDRFIAPPPVDDSPPSTPTSSTHIDSATETGKMIYTFTATGANELQVTEGTVVSILEDDGSWMTVRRSDGQEGLVPTSYVEKIASTPKIGKRGPPPPVKPRGAKKEKKVRALYAYEPQGDDEVPMGAGEEFVVVERDVGGWVRVRVASGGEGLVPGTYVEDV